MRVMSRALAILTGGEADAQPFRIALPRTLPIAARVGLSVARPAISWLLGLDTYRKLYQRVKVAPQGTFCSRALHVLDIRLDLAGAALSEIPNTGGLIVVANHPHGILDGLAIADVIQRRRQDVRILTNHLLAFIPELSELSLFVDPFSGGDTAARSHAGLRAALRWLAEGHALITFPAGSVACMRESTAETPTDSPWRDTIARLAVRTGATVLPAHIEGHNSRWFYRAGRVHSSLRTVLLARELLHHRGRSVSVRLGRPLSLHEELRRGGDPTAFIRDAVDRLANGKPASPSQRVTTADATALESEIRTVPAEYRLLENGPYDVFCVPAQCIPITLQEIGRLRAISFAAVGEGTGEAIDLDRFDNHYQHLFVWNRATREVVGAYRIGETDRILAEHGIDGLYTSTLFRYDTRLINRLSPALELGRSFVRLEYQRSSNALLLLWKGIARFVAASERYRVLFGPVSISNRYRDMSQQLLRIFLTQNFYHRELGALIQAYTLPREAASPVGVDSQVTTDLNDIDLLIARLEKDGKGIPVLLRQYLRLNAKLLGFNVDPAFNDALDALMMVDLAEVDLTILRRYFGKPEAAQIVARFTTARAA